MEVDLTDRVKYTWTKKVMQVRIGIMIEAGTGTGTRIRIRTGLRTGIRIRTK